MNETMTSKESNLSNLQPSEFKLNPNFQVRKTRLLLAFAEFLEDTDLLLEQYLSCEDEVLREGLASGLRSFHAFIGAKQQRLELYMQRSGAMAQDTGKFRETVLGNLQFQRTLLSVDLQARDVEQLMQQLQRDLLAEHFASPSDVEQRLLQLDVGLRLLKTKTALLRLDVQEVRHFLQHSAALITQIIKDAAARFVQRYDAIPEKVEAFEAQAVPLAIKSLDGFFDNMLKHTWSTFNPYDPTSY